jgi:hypothetical protein
MVVSNFLIMVLKLSTPCGLNAFIFFNGSVSMLLDARLSLIVIGFAENAT